jgi:predicted nucleic acid-binding protein
MNPPTQPALLDTAVPMYAVGSAHFYQPACQWIMAEIAQGRIPVAINTEILQEILHRYSSRGQYVIAVQLANDLLRMVPQVYSVTAADMRTAITLFPQFAPQGVKSRDLVHAAVMHNNGLTHIISTDAHFDAIPGITRLDPLALYQQGTQATP